MENWKEIIGYEGDYLISDLGRVRSLRGGSPKDLRGKCNPKGYYSVGLKGEDDKVKYHRIHRLVAIHFIGEPDDYNRRSVNHKNMDKSDNRLINLEWVTHSENQCHQYLNRSTTSKYPGVNWNTHPRGGGSWRSRIKISGKTISLGNYKTEEEAHNARVKYEMENNITNLYNKPNE